ncbi:MAG: dTMP kinase [Clostridiales bacterium]|nr:dTMP kinase [Clostridiales bacterium]
MAHSGVFIVLEGLDGSGTTTQTLRLQNWFNGEGSVYGKCFTTCEPTAGPAGSIARLALNHRLSLDSRTLALLFAADRADHVYKEDNGLREPGLYPLLQQGVHVICDRYLLSSLAYQSLDLPMEWILQINAQVLHPDITVFIDLDPGISERRLQESRLNRDLFEAASIQQRVLAQYEKAIRLLQNEGHRIIRVAGDQSEELVQRDILEGILPLLKDKLNP